jgi:Secretion system C-terminal sorting domain
MFKNAIITFLLVSFSGSFYGQALQRQMISSQGGVYTNSKGLKFSQSIGQLSVTGTSTTPKLIFQQGFQQSFFAVANSSNHLADFSVAVYPNPVLDSFTISLSNALEETSAIKIFTILGQQVYQGQLASFQSQKTISFGTYPNGTYLVQLVSKNQIVTKKIIKN